LKGKEKLNAMKGQQYRTSKYSVLEKLKEVDEKKIVKRQGYMEGLWN